MSDGAVKIGEVERNLLTANTLLAYWLDASRSAPETETIAFLNSQGIRVDLNFDKQPT